MKKIYLYKSLKSLFLTLLISFSLSNLSLFCQTSNLRFDHFSIKDGLPTYELRCIIQDHLGFIWIVSGFGLTKYDGYTFVNYSIDKRKPQIGNSGTFLTSGTFLSIMEDSQGDIWVGQGNGGLNIFLRNEERFEFYFHEENNQHSLSSNRVATIFKDIKGNIWIGTYGGGLNFVKKEHLSKKGRDLVFQHIEISDNVDGINYVNDIYEDVDKNIWICTRNGLFFISDSLSKLIQPIESKLLNTKNNFTCIEQDKNGIFWLGNYRHGIVKYDEEKRKFEYLKFNSDVNKAFSQNKVRSILIDSKDNLWVGTQGGSNTGLFLINREAKQLTRYLNDPFDPNSISETFGHGIVHSIIEDNIGNIWISQREGKLNKINLQKNLFKYHRNYSRNKNQIKFSLETRMFVGRDEKIWFASENGLFQYLSEEDKFIKMEAINEFGKCSIDGKCWGITEDKKGNLWTIIGKKNKLIKYNPNSKEVDCLEQIVKLGSFGKAYFVLEDKNGIFWVGTRLNGLDKWNPKTNEIVNFRYNPNNSSSVSSNSIIRICEDSSNSIWISTGNGYINKINKQTGKIERIYPVKGSGYACDLLVDSKSRLWVGTIAGGIFLFNTDDNSYERITTDHGLPSNSYLGGFSEDHIGNIYCCTGSYLIKFNKDAELEQCYNIAMDDETLHTTRYIKKTKEVYVVSDKGFYRFFADSLKPNLLPPKMVLTDFKLFDESLKVEDNSPLTSSINVVGEIVLSSWQNELSIQYSGLHFIDPTEHKYKYILENFDKNWKMAGKSREVKYTNLSHGEYTFKVLGCNSDGIWAIEPAKLSIIILPPWWFTWWAYLLYFIIFVTLLSYLYYLQRKRLKFRHEFEMKEFETEKLKEVDQMKSKFFANISHEFRTPLTLIKGPIEQLLGNNNLDDPNKIYRMIKRNSERLLNLINELLDLSKLESGKMKLSAQKSDIVSFTKGIAMSFESLAKKKKIQISIFSSNDLIELYFDKEKMQKILTNLLSNAFKFTPVEGEIKVNIEEEITDKKVNIKITDTGIGISQKDLPKIFDRFYQVVSSKTEGHEGTGIGLSLTKELVEIHHGGIKVESEIEKGTTFILSFPIGKDHLKKDELIYLESEMIHQKESIKEEINVSTNDQKDKPILLIVEDNKDVRDFIISIINDKYRFIEAEDGEEGNKKALQHMPDLIISDIMMPKLSGDIMCKNLKKNQITSHIPIILLTAKASGEDKISGLETGADDYLIKPFNESELLVRISNLIVQRRKLREKYLREAEIHPTEVAVTSVDKKFIEKVINLVEENISHPQFNIDQLAEDLAMSRAQLFRKFSSVLGERPNEFVRKYRIRRAAELINQNFGNIAQIAYEVGFNNLSYFSKCFKHIFKVNPHEYRKTINSRKHTN